MKKTITALWEDWSGVSIEYLVLNETSGRITAESAIISRDADSPFAARYEIVCSQDWRVRSVSISLAGKERGISLSSDGGGNWSDGSGTVSSLRGAIDVDITATPFTNTIPVRRLKLKPGESADIITLYIHLPEMTVSTDPQRYTCLEARKLYRFESLDSDFKRDIEFDADGLVATYPGLYKRLR